MNYKTFLINSCMLIMAGFTGANAQSVLSSGSGNATGGSASISYTVGQLVYATNGSASGSITPGIQQPQEKLKITGFEKSSEVSFVSSAYPNPTGDVLRLTIDSPVLKGLTYSLYNITGILKIHGKIESPGTDINMSDLPPAIYFLKINDDHQQLMVTYKIIKK